MGVENRTGAGLGLGGDVGDNRLAVVSIGNRMGTGSVLRGDVGDNGSVVLDDGLVA